MHSFKLKVTTTTMAEDALLMAKLQNLMHSHQNVNGAVEKYIEICFNREYGIKEPVVTSELKTQMELRQFMAKDPKNKYLVYDFIKYMFYRHGKGRGAERSEPDLMDQDDF